MVLLLIYGFSLQILHTLDVEVRETKIMGNSPIIIFAVCILFFSCGTVHGYIIFFLISCSRVLFIQPLNISILSLLSSFLQTPN